MLEQEEPILCFNCDAEFTVSSSYDDPISFCPHCGNEIEGLEDDEEDQPGLFDELDDTLDREQ